MTELYKRLSRTRGVEVQITLGINSGTVSVKSDVLSMITGREGVGGVVSAAAAAVWR